MLNYIIEKFKEFDSITIMNEDFNEFKKIVIGYIENPNNLIINLNFRPSPSFDTVDYINFISYFFYKTDFVVGVLSPNDKFQNLISSRGYKSLFLYNSLLDYIKQLEIKEELFEKDNFFKELANSFLKNQLLNNGIVFNKGKLSIKSNPDSFSNEINYIQVFYTQEIFFSLIVTCSKKDEESFLKINDPQNFETVFSVLTKTSKVLKNMDVKTSHLEKVNSNIIQKYMQIFSQKIDVLDNCQIVSIPFISKEIYLEIEIWIPFYHAKELMDFFNRN